MASRLILVVGGCRSGKSDYARRLVESLDGGRYFVATCPVLDGEMAERVRRHRAERAGGGWETLEEEVELARAVASVPAGASILIDCLTLWIGNIMHRAGDEMPDEAELVSRMDDLIAGCRRRDGLTVMVANEVGLGIVPDNVLARRFRDLAGRVNRTAAAVADEVYFMVCGIARRIK